MVDEIIPADQYPEPPRIPLDVPQAQPQSTAGGDYYNPPPRSAEEPLPLPRGATGEPAKPKEKGVLPPYVPTPPNELKDRVTLTLQAHHERWGYNPRSFQVQFTSNTEESEQAYERQMRVTSEKKVQLQFDYPLSPGMIMIANRTGNTQFTRPTPQQAQALRERNLLVSLCPECPDEHAFIVRPNRPFIAELQDETEIWLKATSGICEIEVFIFPR